MSGTNAHVIIEETADVTQHAAVPEVRAPGPIPWLLSGRSLEALHAQGARLLSQVRQQPELEPVDVGFSLATARSPLEYRAVVPGCTAMS